MLLWMLCPLLLYDYVCAGHKIRARPITTTITRVSRSGTGRQSGSARCELMTDDFVKRNASSSSSSRRGCPHRHTWAWTAAAWTSSGLLLASGCVFVCIGVAASIVCPRPTPLAAQDTAALSLRAGDCTGSPQPSLHSKAAHRCRCVVTMSAFLLMVHARTTMLLRLLFGKPM